MEIAQYCLLTCPDCGADVAFPASSALSGLPWFCPTCSKTLMAPVSVVVSEDFSVDDAVFTGG